MTAAIFLVLCAVSGFCLWQINRSMNEMAALGREAMERIQRALNIIRIHPDDPVAMEILRAMFPEYRERLEEAERGDA